ncbi:MAG: aryl-sulfate sulfotransferase [Candidatus Omnitrophica bacterium]|nr:aryl-sulfate sulfotransferase [Candidatus Omnitrophota bacterium]
MRLCKNNVFLGFSVVLAVASLFYSAAMAEEDFSVDIYKPDKACNGTTLFPDNHIKGKPRVVEVDMQGNIVWEYVLPHNLRPYTNPGFDVESLSNGNFVLELPRKGIYEIDRNGNVLWTYLDGKVSHDVDRLANGNTLLVFGNEDGLEDAQVKEVDPSGKIVWSWHAKDHFYKEPYKDIYHQGWTHTNAASRMSNGNTLISLRNFHFIVEVDPQGAVVRKIGEGILQHQHDPEVLASGNILIANHGRPQGAIEVDPQTDEIVWQFDVPDPSAWPIRDANRLANGNTLITATTKILEVTPQGEIVWQMSLKGISFERREGPARGFYKATRISQ